MIKQYSVERFTEAIKELNLCERLKFNILMGDEFSVRRERDIVHITYTRPVQAFRALALVKAKGNDFSVAGNPVMEEIGYMVDVARNAVPTVKTLKKVALNLALFGYTRMYLYLQDMLSIEGEPFCGYLRGRYTRTELRELDEYCAGLGIEVVPCVQTLAHLGTIFRWHDYKDICDTDDILLIGENKTYRFIDNLLREISLTFRSSNVHIGFDEAYGVGLGEYLSKNGFRERFEIMSEHINKIGSLSNVGVSQSK